MTPPPSEVVPVAQAQGIARHRRDFEAIAVVVATIVGLLSLAVSAYTAYTLRVQTRAQVYPYLQVVTSPADGKVGLHNKGVGPAFIRSVRIESGGHPVRDWAEFFKALHVTLKGGVASSTINHAAIAANEHWPVLAFGDVSDLMAFAQIDRTLYRFDVCYCSVLDECWTIDNDPAATAPAPVSSCRIVPEAEFTQ